SFSTRSDNSTMTCRSITFIDRPGASQVTSAIPSASVATLKLPSPIELRLLRIGFAGTAQEAPPALIAVENQVDVGIMGALARCAGADLEVKRVARRAVDQMMAVGDPSLESGSIARLQKGFTAVLDQHDFALQHVDELVLGLMPMPQGGRCTRFQSGQVDA